MIAENFTFEYPSSPVEDSPRWSLPTGATSGMTFAGSSPNISVVGTGVCVVAHQTKPLKSNQAAELTFQFDDTNTGARSTGVVLRWVDASNNIIASVDHTGSRSMTVIETIAGSSSTLLTVPSPVSLAPPTPTASITGSGSTTYSYRVSAFGTYGESVPSVAAVASSAPNTLSLTAYVTISWTAVAGATGYAIYGRTDGAWRHMASVSSGTTSYADKGADSPTWGITVQQASIKAEIIGSRVRAWYEAGPAVTDRPPDAAANLAGNPTIIGNWGMMLSADGTNDIVIQSFAARLLPSAVFSPPMLTVTTASGFNLTPVTLAASTLGAPLQIEWEMLPTDSGDFPEPYRAVTDGTVTSHVVFVRHGYPYQARCRGLYASPGPWTPYLNINPIGSPGGTKWDTKAWQESNWPTQIDSTPTESAPPTAPDYFPAVYPEYVMEITEAQATVSVGSVTGKDRQSFPQIRGPRSFKFVFDSRTSSEYQLLIDFFELMQAKVRPWNWTHPLTGEQFILRFNSDDYNVSYTDYSSQLQSPIAKLSFDVIETTINIVPTYTFNLSVNPNLLIYTPPTIPPPTPTPPLPIITPPSSALPTLPTTPTYTTEVVYYVSPAGNDSTGVMNSTSNTFLTIAGAITKAASDRAARFITATGLVGIFMLRGGTYVGPNLAMNSYTYFGAYGSGDETNRPIVTQTSGNLCFGGLSLQSVYFRDLRMTTTSGSQATNGIYLGTSTTPSNDIQIDHCEFDGFQQFAINIVGAATNVRIDFNWIANTFDPSTSTESCSGLYTETIAPYVRCNVFYHNGWTAPYDLTDTAMNTAIMFRHGWYENPGGGVAIGGIDFGNLYLRNAAIGHVCRPGNGNIQYSVFWDNGNAVDAFLTSGWTASLGGTIAYCCCFGAITNDFLSYGGGFTGASISDYIHDNYFAGDLRSIQLDPAIQITLAPGSNPADTTLPDPATTLATVANNFGIWPGPFIEIDGGRSVTQYGNNVVTATSWTVAPTLLDWGSSVYGAPVADEDQLTDILRVNLWNPDYSALAIRSWLGFFM